MKLILTLKKTKKVSIFLLLTTLLSSQAIADDKANKIIKQAINAYGGEKLLKMQNLTLEEKNYSYAQWQSNTPIQGAMISYLNENQTVYTIDFLNKRKVFKQATSRLVGNHHSNLVSVKHRLFTNNTGYIIDHVLQEVKQSPNITFDNVASNSDRLLDTLIIKQLYQDLKHAQWIDVAYVEGKPQDILTFNRNKQNEYTVFIDRESNYLTQLIISRRGQKTSYNFFNHTKSNDIAWAQSLFIGNSKQPIYHAKWRKVSFNNAQPSQFNVPLNYKKAITEEYYDSASLTVRKIADNIYFAGQDWGYTLFIDTGDYLISVGAWQTNEQSHAWRNALSLFRQTTGNSKPVKQHIVTHHHFDHMMGLKDILEQGVDLIMHQSLVAAVEEHLGTSISEDKLITVDQADYLANNSIMLFDLPTSHANHNLAFYLPKQKILFTEDIFGSSLKSGFHSPANWPDGDTYFRLDTLTKQLKDLKISPKYFISSHHARILTDKEIEQALTVEHPSNKTILKKLFSTTL